MNSDNQSDYSETQAVEHTNAIASEEAVQVADPHAPVKSALSEAVAEWVVSHINNSVLSRDTIAYNYLMSILPALHDAVIRKL